MRIRYTILIFSCIAIINISCSKAICSHASTSPTGYSLKAVVLDYKLRDLDYTKPASLAAYISLLHSAERYWYTDDDVIDFIQVERLHSIVSLIRLDPSNQVFASEAGYSVPILVFWDSLKVAQEWFIAVESSNFDYAIAQNALRSSVFTADPDSELGRSVMSLGDGIRQRMRSSSSN